MTLSLSFAYYPLKEGGRGNRSEREPQLLDQKLLKQNNISYLSSVDSTNRQIRLLAEKGAEEFFTLVAEEQTAGRGRLERKWFSPPATGLWFSVLFLPQHLKPAEAAPLTLVAAVATTRTLRKIYSLPVQVKWPNDLLIGGKKVAGILTEMKGKGENIEYLITGLGLNVNQVKESFPPELRGGATSLYMESDIFKNRTLLLIELHQALLEAYRLFIQEGFAPFRETWKQFSINLGCKVKVSGPKGSVVTGKAVDLDDQGALVVQDKSNKLHRLHFGEILE